MCMTKLRNKSDSDNGIEDGSTQMRQTNPSHAINRSNLAENSHPTGITTNFISNLKLNEKWFLIEMNGTENSKIPSF